MCGGVCSRGPCLRNEEFVGRSRVSLGWDFLRLCVHSVRTRARRATINAESVTGEQHVRRDLISLKAPAFS